MYSLVLWMVVSVSLLVLLVTVLYQSLYRVKDDEKVVFYRLGSCSQGKGLWPVYLGYKVPIGQLSVRM